jgi:hypothetical protein
MPGFVPSARASVSVAELHRQAGTLTPPHVASQPCSWSWFASPLWVCEWSCVASSPALP